MSTGEHDGGAKRLSDFEAEVAGLRLKGGSIERERQFATLGLVLVGVGVAVAIVMAVISKSATDPRDQYTYLSWGLVGLTLAVVGVVVWLRYSLTHYLRYWLLRLIYAQRKGSGG